ncbi:hypothetical protein Trydic_g1419 [Trypoxylus dichotomus]
MRIRDKQSMSSSFRELQRYVGRRWERFGTVGGRKELVLCAWYDLACMIEGVLYLSLNIEVRILYGLQARASYGGINTCLLKTKRVVEMKTLRTIKGLSLGDQIRSKVIRENLEIQDMVRFTRARPRRHIDRRSMSERAMADLQRDSARAEHLRLRRLNNIKKNRRNKTKS